MDSVAENQLRVVGTLEINLIYYSLSFNKLELIHQRHYKKSFTR